MNGINGDNLFIHQAKTNQNTPPTVHGHYEVSQNYIKSAYIRFSFTLLAVCPQVVHDPFEKKIIIEIIY